MSLKSEKAADLALIVAAMGEPVVWNDKTYTALIVDPIISQELMMAGYVDQAAFTIKFLKSDFRTVIPKQGDSVNFNGQEFIIHKVNNRSQLPLLIVEVGCKDD